MSLITTPIIPVGNRLLGSSLGFRRNKVLYDYAIADLALLAATSKSFSYSRVTAPFRKEQFDASSNPGEQTLTTWWLRSQSSFHEGAGIKFMEPVSDEEVANAYMDSVGVDPWTPGQLKLLKATTQKKSAAASVQVMGAIDGTTDIYLHASGTTVSRETATSSGAFAWGGSSTVLSMCNDGANYYIADAVSIWKGTLAGGTGTALWNTGNANVTIGWAKQRLVAGIGAAVYELVGGTPPTLPTALYTHPSSAWKWTSIAEGPTAIYFGGYNGTESSIYKFALSTSGAMPTLTSATVAAKLPYGERVHSLFAYLGAYIAIGTNKGVRIGLINSQGDISYGPLVLTSTQPVESLTGRDQYIFAGCTNQINGVSGLWRIDLGSPQNDGGFPYATDLSADVTGAVNSVSVFGASGRMVFGVSGQGSYMEHATNLVASGYLTTGFIRFNTVEPKQFRFISARTADSHGSVAVQTYDRTGTLASIATISGYDPQDYDMGRTSAEEYVALRFTLNRDAGDATLGPTLLSWQVKALPATKRSRIITVPFLLFEEMRDSKGVSVPPTDVHAVLSVLEQYEDSAQPLLFAELCHNPNRTELVVIDEVRYEQVTPPTGNCSGDGGIVQLTLRTVQ